MYTHRLDRLLPLSGLVFGFLFIAFFVTAGETPDVTASGQQVIAHYEQKPRVVVGLILLFCATFFLIFFIGALRTHLRDTGSNTLTNIAFGGGIAIAVCLSLLSMTQFALLDAADLRDPQVARTVNVIDNDILIPTVAGLAALYVSTGLHCLVSDALPPWLRSLTLLFGALCFAGPASFFAVVLFPIWAAVVSIVLYRTRAGHHVGEPHD